MVVIGRSNGAAEGKFQRGCGDSWRCLAGGGGEGGIGDGEADGRRRRRRQGRAGRNGMSAAAGPGWVGGQEEMDCSSAQCI